jgi:two-component system, LytTR family, sensor kinase
VLWIVFGVSLLVIVLTLIGTQLTEPPPRRVGPGPVFPRIRVPPTGSPGQLLRAMGIGSLTWYACILSAPLFIWMSGRLRFDRRHWPASLAIYIAVIIALVSVTAVVQHRLSFGGSPMAPGLGLFVRAALLTGTLPFIAIAAGAHALEARTRASDREIEAARMKSQLAEARLEALTAQLQPHFLFNTLQAISTLIHHDPAGADRMLASLSDLLREVLRHGAREVPLEEELRVLQPYLDISRWRFGERLSIRIDVDADARRGLVPFFVLQPLVENALHHGVSSRAGAGLVHIQARRNGNRLWLSVADDGPGAETSDVRTGIGLPNTKARLEELYGDACTLQLGRRETSGFEVRVGIPYREAPESERNS